MRFTAIFRQVPEGSVAFVEELPGANTQGATLDEARTNLTEAVEMVLEANRTLAEESIEGQDVIREPFDITAQRSDSSRFATPSDTGANFSERARNTPST